ncbi:MAG TPA: hypothetical protein VFK56_01310 [Mycobacterium sp.]|jgi:hypothetical protein|nr:hypothetical protein [Mycobacterium sp.]
MDDEVLIGVDIQEVLNQSAVVVDAARQTRRAANETRVRTQELLERMRELRATRPR